MTLYRAICVHAAQHNFIWRGPERADIYLAQIDANEHSNNCNFSVAIVIDNTHPHWE